MKADKPDYTGRTVICIASGPSLTKEDCDTVKTSGLPTIVTNTTFKLCPWADVLFGFDAKWWHYYHEEVKQVFKGRLLSVSHAVRRLGVESLHNADWFQGFGNSGACAIALAIAGNANKIVLLGYDCGSATHWHGDHPKELTNCLSIRRWPAQFASMAKLADSKGIPVINASRETMLTCFKRGTLLELL